jgi:DNA modification methylase
MTFLPGALPVRSIHPFPARMAASIPWQVLSGEEGNLRVLDPMAGSGTSLVVARNMGHQAIGFDTDPLAVLVSSVWCNDVHASRVLAAAERVVSRASCMQIPASDAYSFRADTETKSFIRYWFDLRSRRQLSALSLAITQVRDADIRSVLWCALSRLIITKESGVSRALDVSHSRPHRHYTVAPIQPLHAYLRSVRQIVHLAPFQKGSGFPRPRIERADARELPLGDDSIDLVITSPPYLNAIDYVRGHKLSLVWMGHTTGGLRTLRGTNIGTEVAGAFLASAKVRRVTAAMGQVNDLPLRFQRILWRYLEDMNRVMQEIARVLTRGGRALVVIGNCTIRGVYLRNSRAIEMLAESHGMTLERRSQRAIPDSHRYLPPPRSGSGKEMQRRMRTEVVLSFRR